MKSTELNESCQTYPKISNPQEKSVRNARGFDHEMWPKEMTLWECVLEEFPLSLKIRECIAQHGSGFTDYFIGILKNCKSKKYTEHELKLEQMDESKIFCIFF